MPAALVDILAKLNEQLEWRGPQGKPIGVITLTRDEAGAVYVLLAATLRQQAAERLGEPGAGEDSPLP